MRTRIAPGERLREDVARCSTVTSTATPTRLSETAATASPTTRTACATPSCRRHVRDALRRSSTDDGNGRPARRRPRLRRGRARPGPHADAARRSQRERERLQKDKEGYEIAQGQLLGHVLANPNRPPPDRRDAAPDAARARPPRRVRAHRPASTSAPRRSPATGNVGTVELRNPRHLNAEDDTTTGPLRGRDRPRAARPAGRDRACCAAASSSTRATPGRRIFGAGLNLTHLYRGQISYLFFPVRDLGLVHKVYRGLSRAGDREAVDRGRGDVRDRRRLPAAADRRPHPRRAGLPLHAARAQRGDHPRRREPAAAALRRRPPRAPGDPLRPRARARGAGRRHRRAGRDGRGDRAHAPRTSPAPARSAASPTGARCGSARSRWTSSAPTWRPTAASRRSATSARR